MTERPLSTTDLEEFEPRQIIFREMRITADIQATRYVQVDVPTKWGVQRFRNLLARAARHNYSRNSNDAEEQIRLDIPLYRSSIIVLAILEGSNYVFAETPVKMKTDSTYPDYFYGGLRFVDEDGNPHDSYVEDCKVIYFQARFKRGYPGDPHRQAFNYYVDKPSSEREADGRGVRAVAEIDPDVRHPGVGGEVYEPYP
jgi:hypothetical protein